MRRCRLVGGVVGAATAVAMLLSLSVAAAHAKDKVKSFKSPLKNFEVAPPQYCLGTHTQLERDDEAGSVSFTSDLGELNRIDYFRVQGELAATLAGPDSVARNGFFQQAIDNMLAENGAAVLSESPMEVGGVDAHFTVARFPRAAAVESMVWKDGKQVQERADSIRGLLVFFRGGYLYILHCEVGIDFAAMWPLCDFPPSGPSLEPEQRDLAARNGVEQLYASIKFK